MTDNEVKWLIVGKLLRRNLMARVGGEPVAYSYNGVRLPKLPVSNDHPNSAVCTSSYGYTLLLTIENFSTPVSASGTFMAIATGTRRFNFVDGEWVEFKEPFTVITCSPIWANYNVYYDDSAGGGLFLPASVPVPVYE